MWRDVYPSGPAGCKAGEKGLFKLPGAQAESKDTQLGRGLGLAHEIDELMERRDRFDLMMTEMGTRFNKLCGDWEHKMDLLHSENRVRLQNIDQTARSNGETLAGIGIRMEAAKIKMDALYGNGSGRPGAVERLSEKVDAIGNKVMYGCGGVAATVVLVGWYLASHK
jgi:hypothetical protein